MFDPLEAVKTFKRYGPYCMTVYKLATMQISAISKFYTGNVNQIMSNKLKYCLEDGSKRTILIH